MTGRLYLMAAAIASAALLASPAALAQSTPIAKPSPYQGVSQPPSTPILSDEDEAPAAALNHRSAPAPAVAATPVTPVPEVETSSASQLPSASPVESPAAKPMVDPGSKIVTYVPGPANALPEGTVFRIYMMTDLMASDSPRGTPFRGKLVKQLMYNDRIVVPAGSELVGRVTYATYGRRIGGRSLIHLVPQEFILPDGTRYQVHAQVIDTAGSDTKATGEGDITSSGQGKRALIEMGAGTGGGALAGGLIAGPVGAGVGSLVGAGAMGAHWLFAQNAAEIPENSTVVFSLKSPMFLTPMTADQASQQLAAQNGD